MLADGVWSTYSFGPALVENGDIVEGIESYEADADTRHGYRGITRVQALASSKQTTLSSWW
jgi:hypothetical protein